MVVLGIDPGTSVTGFGIVQARRGGIRLIEAGLLRSRPGGSLPGRVLTLCQALESVLERHPPDRVALEGIFHARNARSALTLAHLRGAFLLTLARRGLDVAEYSPREVKKAVTGYGAADKEQVRRMVAALAAGRGGELPLDASDAVAVAICHAHSLPVAAAVRRAE